MSTIVEVSEDLQRLLGDGGLKPATLTRKRFYDEVYIFFSLLSVNNGRALNFRYFYFQLAKFFSDAHARPLEEILTSEEDRKFFSDALWRYLINFFWGGDAGSQIIIES